MDTTWKVILKALLSKAFKILFPFWHEEMGVSAPCGGANLPSRVWKCAPAFGRGTFPCTSVAWEPLYHYPKFISLQDGWRVYHAIHH